MEFFKAKDWHWKCRCNPFIFNIFYINNQYDIVWKYGFSTGQEQADSLESAKEWCQQFALKKSLEQLQWFDAQKS